MAFPPLFNQIVFLLIVLFILSLIKKAEWGAALIGSIGLTLFIRWGIVKVNTFIFYALIIIIYVYFAWKDLIKDTELRKKLKDTAQTYDVNFLKDGFWGSIRKFIAYISVTTFHLVTDFLLDFMRQGIGIFAGLTLIGLGLIQATSVGIKGVAKTEIQQSISKLFDGTFPWEAKVVVGDRKSVV
jgi:hypothetical protein